MRGALAASARAASNYPTRTRLEIFRAFTAVSGSYCVFDNACNSFSTRPSQNTYQNRRNQRQLQRERSHQGTLNDDKDGSRARISIAAGDNLQRSTKTPLPAATTAAAAGDRRGEGGTGERGDSRCERGRSRGGAPGGRESSGSEMSSLATGSTPGGREGGGDTRRQRRSTLSTSESDLSSESGARSAVAAEAEDAGAGEGLTTASAGKARPQSRRGADSQRKEQGSREEPSRRDSGEWRTGGGG